MIREIHPEDASQLCDIYNYYITETAVTFEETPVSEEEMKRRIEKVVPRFPWMVYEENGLVLGYTYASMFRERIAYRFTAESTVYLRRGYEGRGIGTQLYRKLIVQLKARGFHVVIGCLTLPNDTSVYLHEKMGFRKAGILSQTGYKFGRWLDIGFWELII